MTKIYTTALLLFFFAWACKTPVKAYDRGNYEDAVERAVKKLQKDPSDAATRQLLQQAYREAVARREAQIRNLLNSHSENPYEKVYFEYRQLQQLYQTVNQNPASSKAVAATDYASYVETYRQKAATAYIESGMRRMQEDNRQSYQEAYRQFRAAQSLKPDDYEIKQRVQQAYDAAVLTVLVIPMNTAGSNYYYKNASYTLRNFQDGIIRELNQQTASDFVRYVSEWDAQSRDLQPDEVLEMRLGFLRIGQPYDQTESRKVEKEVVVKETVHKKDSVTKEYATVRATINTTRRILVSEAGLILTTRDARGRTVWTDEAGGEHRWETKLVTYTGDERALSPGDKELLNQPAGERAPSEEAIVENLLRQIQTDLTRRLRSHYSRNY